MLSRRLFLAAAPAAALSACARPPVEPPPAPVPVPEPIPPLPARYHAVAGEPFPVPAIPEGVVPQKLWMQEVQNPFPSQSEGTVMVDPDACFLYLVGKDDTALRYGVSVGAAGYGWQGTARVQFRREWPRWKVPQEMAERQPELAKWSVANGGMPGGPDNPLGARALYLFKDGKDTLYRIHGGCEPQYLGKAVSSGCIRMLDQDVIDIAERVQHGATVVVLPSGPAPVAGPATI